MSLRDYKPRTADVPFPGGSVTVRGLTPSEVAELIKSFKDDAIKIYTLIKSMDIDSLKTDNDFFARMISVVSDVPNLVAKLIAVAADEPDEYEHVKKLPLALQFDIICKIGEMTFTVDGDLKKLLANMVEKMGGVNGLLKVAVDALDQILPKKPFPSGVGTLENQ